MKMEEIIGFTPYYTSPEVKQLKDTFNPYKTDIWCVGLVLAILLETGFSNNLNVC